MEVIVSIFENARLEVEKEYEKVDKQLGIVSNLRLLVSVIGILGFIISIVDKKIIYFVIFLCCCIIFIGLLSWYEKLSANKEYLQAKQKVLLRQNNRKKNQWSTFDDTGMDFLDDNSFVEKDIDIFGENSLFQYLSVCNTEEGRNGYQLI